MTAYVDTNIIIRHLTGEPHGQAARATRYLGLASDLILEDVIFAEVAYVLESVYRASRTVVALSLRALLGFHSIRVRDSELLQRAVELYELARLDFADAYLVASAERSGVGVVASFDRGIDRVGTIQRDEPS